MSKKANNDMRSIFMAMARLEKLHNKKTRTKAEEKEYQELVKIFEGDENE